MEPDGIIEVISFICLLSLKYFMFSEVEFEPVTLSALQSNWNEITDNFDDMNLKETLLRGIYAYGFEKPSAIQQRAIIPCIKGDFGEAEVK